MGLTSGVRTALAIALVVATTILLGTASPRGLTMVAIAFLAGSLSAPSRLL